jgi:hypothetical protein
MFNAIPMEEEQLLTSSIGISPQPLERSDSSIFHNCLPYNRINMVGLTLDQPLCYSPWTQHERLWVRRLCVFDAGRRSLALTSRFLYHSFQGSTSLLFDSFLGASC